MRLEWDPALDTGDERVDAEHRTLFEMFNDLQEAAATDGPDAVRGTLESLTAYVATHFAHEEERMRATGFPDGLLESHVAEHRALTESVRERVLAYRTDGLRAEDLVGFLRAWLNEHVREVDRMLVEHVRGAEAPEG